MILSTYFALYALLLPQFYTPPPVEIVEENVSCYTAEISQTDDRPTEMADGRQVFVGAIANNCHPFGTKVGITGRTYEVADRMNRRYSCSHYDLYMTDKSECLKFGRKKLKIVIYK